jgi:hypothetical protein
MTRSFRLVRWTAVVAAVAFAWHLSVASLSARPDYNKEFGLKYPDNAAYKALQGGAKCNACHGKNDQGKDDKKVRNKYGMEFGKALGGKNVKDAAKIKDALEMAGKGASAVKDKTFADLIKDGKLPAAEE